MYDTKYNREWYFSMQLYHWRELFLGFSRLLFRKWKVLGGLRDGDGERELVTLSAGISN